MEKVFLQCKRLWLCLVLLKPVQHAVDPRGGLPEDEPSHWTTPHPSSDLMVNAMAQQSQALTAHFTNSNPMSDLVGGGGLGHSSATRGAQRREKLQNDLALGSFTYFLQVA